MLSVRSRGRLWEVASTVGQKGSSAYTWQEPCGGICDHKVGPLLLNTSTFRLI